MVFLHPNLSMDSSSPQPNLVEEESTRRFTPLFWALIVATGIGAGLGGAGLMLILRTIQHIFWNYSTGDFLSAVKRTSAEHRVIVLTIGGLVGGLGLLVRKYIIKGEGGEVSESIWFKEGKFPFIRTTFSSVLSIVIVGLGASLGREGAPKQVGAAIASKLSDWCHMSHPQRRLLAACGAGAGMAAVYNVPFGGALFAMEVLLGTLAFPMVLPALLTSLIATGVAWIYLPIQPTYKVPSFHLHLSQIVWALIFGPIAGIASVGYVRAIVWAERLNPKGWRMLIGPVVVYAALGAVAIRYPQLLGNGKDTAHLAFLDLLSWKLLFLLAFLKLAATAGCLRSGTPGGLFTPTVTFGALLGGGCGQLWSHFPWAIHSGSYAIIGAASVLAASTQGPVSAIVLVVELTYHTNALLVPMMLAVAGATIIQKKFEPRSIYTAKVEVGKSATKQTAPQIPTSFDELLVRNFPVVSGADHYSAVLKALLNSHSSSVWVLDDKGAYTGQITTAKALNPDIEGPLDTTTGSDLAEYIPPLTANMTHGEAVATLEGSIHAELPVIEAESWKMIGVLKK